MVENGVLGLFYDPGLGKTSTALAAFKILKEEGLVKHLFIIAPLRVCHSVWPKEVVKWRNFEKLTVRVLHGPKKAARYKEAPDIFVINPEGLSWLCEQRIPPNSMLVVDESTKFKSASSKRFKLLKTILKKFKRRYILTGTPTPNSLLDLFGQIYILDQGAALGRYITHYRNRFFTPSGYGGYTYLPNPTAMEDITEAISPLIHRLEARDYLKLPELVTSTIEVELPPKARKLYDAVEKEFVAELEGEIILAGTAAVASGKCRQIANGGIYVDDLHGLNPTRPGKGVRQFEAVHNAKTEALVDLVEELNGAPALIAYAHHHDLERIKKALGNIPHIGGGVSTKRGLELETLWNRGEVPLLAVQPASVSHGLNLQEAGKAIIWYSLTWNFDDYEQLPKRMLRQGRKEPVFMYHIVARNTIDQLMVQVLGEKDTRQKSVLGRLKNYYLKG